MFFVFFKKKKTRQRGRIHFWRFGASGWIGEQPQELPLSGAISLNSQHGLPEVHTAGAQGLLLPRITDTSPISLCPEASTQDLRLHVLLAQVRRQVLSITDALGIEDCQSGFGQCYQNITGESYDRTKVQTKFLYLKKDLPRFQSYRKIKEITLSFLKTGGMWPSSGDYV